MSSPVDITLVTAASCHFCADAQTILDTLSGTYPMRVRLVDMMSDDGRELVVKHRMPFPPLLIVDGTVFGYGRISERKLTKHLAALANTVEVK
ncbi:glutaredoxin [Demequina sp. SO4-13]|uniref:glutaredoxin n=1 Tax=Demequina sp. SO4-13 TaxID=3401027 RepID=UPI003AF62261